MHGNHWSRRRARSTGTHVVLASPGLEACVEEGWLTICEEHACVCSHETRELAEQWRAHPEDWCEVCLGNEPPPSENY